MIYQYSNVLCHFFKETDDLSDLEGLYIFVQLLCMTLKWQYNSELMGVSDSKMPQKFMEYRTYLFLF